MRYRPGVAIVIVAALSAAGCRDARPPAASESSGAGDAAAPMAPTELRFVDVAAEAGLDTVLHCGGADKDHILESTGSGAAFLDYDGDGRLDVYLVNAWALDEDPSAVRVRGRNRLYRGGADGRFTDVTERAGVGDDGWGCGVCVADYDGDGLVDIYVTNFGPNVLYRNRGDGAFDEVASSAGVDEPGWGAGASFFDADGDRDLDLYVANYIECTLDEVLAATRTSVWRNKANTMAGPFGLRGGKDRFYRNRGDGTFEDATDQAGMTDLAEGYGLAVLAGDLDLDGDADVYVANDSNPNALFRNDGDGTFSEVGPWCGAGYSADAAAQAGMGLDAADLDGDGLPEMIVSNFALDYCTLYHNLGDLFFEDRTRRHDLAAVTRPYLSWGCGFTDVDLDGRSDLVIVNGHIYPQVEDHPELNESYEQRPLLFRHDGTRLVDVSDRAGPGFAITRSARGLAVGDYDDDGDGDLLITAIDAPPLLLRNDTPRRGHRLTLRLLDRNGAPAIGARAALGGFDGGAPPPQSGEVRSGSTYQSQNGTDLLFGLGAREAVPLVEITWPGGRRTILRDVAADQTLLVREPEPAPPS